MASLSKKAAAVQSSSSKQGTPASQRSVSLAKKRRAVKEDAMKVTLDRVLGLTCHSTNSLAVSDSCIAYPAGNVAVLLGLSKKNKQLYIYNKKAISCLSLSVTGSHLALGECGHDPMVMVWELSGTEDPHSIAQLKGHEFGIQCVSFYPGQKYLVSIGYMHDRQVIVWNWKTGIQLVHGKFGQSVNSVAFSQDHSSKLGNSYFVTAHHRRIQYWYFDVQKDGNKKGSSYLLKSRSAILGDLQSQTFVDVACGRGILAEKTYALTKAGRLCVFDSKRTLDKFTEVKVSRGVCLSLNDSYLFCGCCDGIIRVFDPFSLDYIISLPRPHPLGVDLSASASPGEVSEGVGYPDAIAMVINNNKLSVVYVDHSLYIWDVGNLKQVAKLHSYLYHNACVWDISTYPGVASDNSPLPDSAFITCSSDSTVRFWCMDQSMAQWNPRNLYSKELLRILYISGGGDKEVLKDHSTLPGDASAVADATRGLRCIACRRDGKHVAVGDREGNVRVYDLEFMDKVYEEVAHDSEVLSLTFSEEIQGGHYMASASRDRMVHVFNSTSLDHSNEEGGCYEPIQSLPDHSASVTAVCFTTNDNQELQLLSCGADKSVLYHTKEKTPDTMFHRSQHVVSKTAIYDMAVDKDEKKFYISGPDRFLRVFAVSGGKKLTAIKVPAGDEGGLLKVTLDPTGLYAATSCADKSILVFDLTSGECISKLCGHSEVVTQLKFSRDGRFLYSVSGDSCIFVWKLAPSMIQTVQEMSGKKSLTRSASFGKVSSSGSVPSYSSSPAPTPVSTDNKGPLSHEMACMDKSKPLELLEEGMHRDSTQQPPVAGETPSGTDSTDQADFDFRLSMLPEWAQKAALSRPSVAHMAANKGGATARKDSGPPSKVAGGSGRRSRAVTTETRFAMDRGGQVESDHEDEDTIRRQTRVLAQETKSDGDVTVSSSVNTAVETSTDVDQVSPGNSPTEDVEGNPPEIFQSDSDGEEGVVYDTVSTSHLDVDPSTFSVTTPTKPSRPESQADEVDIGEAECPADGVESPPNKPDKEIEPTQEFLSLLINDQPTRDNTTMEFLHPHMASLQSSRLSISAKFLKRHQEQFLTAPERSSPAPSSDSEEEEKPISRDMLLQLYSPPPRDVDVRRELAFTEGSPMITVIPPAEGKGEVVTLQDPATKTEDTSKTTKMEGDGREDTDAGIESEPSAKRSRETFDDAVSQTKKRLEELGYEIPAKDGRKRKKESERLLSSPVKRSADKRKGSPKKSSASKYSRGLKATKEPLKSPCEESPLIGKVSACLDSLQSDFKALALLHEEAVKAGASQVMDVISAGIASHRQTLVNWEVTEGTKKVEDTKKTDSGVRKRSATSPVDMRNKKDRRKFTSNSRQSISGIEIRGSSSGSVSRGGGTDGSLLRSTVEEPCEADNIQYRRNVTVRTSDSVIGTGASVKKGTCGEGDKKTDQENVLQVIADGRKSSGSGAGRGNPSSITLTEEQVQEARDLMHTLMGFFSS